MTVKDSGKKGLGCYAAEGECLLCGEAMLATIDLPFPSEV